MKRGDAYILTPEDVKILETWAAKSAGISLRKPYGTDGILCKNGRIDYGKKFDNKFKGKAGELAYKRLVYLESGLVLKMSWSINESGADFDVPLKTDIKTSPDWTWNLQAHRSHKINDAEIYVLMRHNNNFKEPGRGRYTFWGWIHAEDLIKDQNLKYHEKYKDPWYEISADKLVPSLEIEELKKGTGDL